MGLMFGNDDNIDCIQNVPIKGAKGESLCLAHRTTLHFFGAGVYLTDNGYVLRPVDGGKTYYPMTPAEIQKHQAEQALPTPLPPYSISAFQYAFGYSLWIVVAVCVVIGVVQHMRKKARLAEDAATPTSFGPPTLATDTDRFVDEQLKPLLAPGETVMHQAYSLDRVPQGNLSDAKAVAYYVGLTSERRVLFIKARNGAFGPLHENLGTEAFDASRIAGIAVDDRCIVLTIANAGQRAVWVSPTKKLSNQRAFLRDLPRILGGEQPAIRTRAVVA